MTNSKGQDRIAQSAIRSTVRIGVATYDRTRMLPRLIPATPDMIADLTPTGRRAILRLLLKALRRERTRGRSGHWTYSLDRHIGLVQALVGERGVSPKAVSGVFDTARR
jgi:hypothetical protein